MKFYNGGLIVDHLIFGRDALEQVGYEVAGVQSGGALLNEIVLTYEQPSNEQLQPGAANGLYQLASDFATAVALQIRHLIYTARHLDIHTSRRDAVHFAAQAVPYISHTQDDETKSVTFKVVVYNQALLEKYSAKIYVPWRSTVAGRGSYQSINFQNPPVMQELLAGHLFRQSTNVQTAQGQKAILARFEIGADTFTHYVNTVAAYMYCKYHLEVLG